MGCDIHLRVQKRVNDEWVFVEDKDGERIETWYWGRNYNLFGILANVRNGVGFAGVDTGDGFRPISDPRGLPDGLTETLGEFKDADGDDDYEFWFGNHSHSWLLLSELLDYDWYQQSKCRGWINGPQFEKWDRMRRWHPAPEEYCGGVSGRDVEHISEQEMRRRIEEVTKAFSNWKDAANRIEQRYASTYCLVEWPVFYSEAAGSFYTQTMPRMIRLAKEAGGPENVRIVFGFDS